MELPNLPSEVVEMIGENLSGKDVINLCLSSKDLSSTCQSEQLWKSLFIRDFPEYSRKSNETWHNAHRRLTHAFKQAHVVATKLITYLKGKIGSDGDWRFISLDLRTLSNIETFHAGNVNFATFLNELSLYHNVNVKMPVTLTFAYGPNDIFYASNIWEIDEEDLKHTFVDLMLYRVKLDTDYDKLAVDYDVDDIPYTSDYIERELTYTAFV